MKNTKKSAKRARHNVEIHDYDVNEIEPSVLSKAMPYFVLFALGSLIRLFAMLFIDLPFTSDVFAFQFWAVHLYEGGLSYFYYSETFTDYPPAYMYVLYLIGAIRAAMGEPDFHSPAFTRLIFMPAVISDIVTGLVFYYVCAVNWRDEKPFGLHFWLALTYLFSPVILLNSAIWGQVDAVHTLLLLIALYGISRKQSLLIYLVYGLAVITKPQSLIVAPVFLYSAFLYVREREFSAKAILSMVGFAAATFLLMGLLAFPFGLPLVIEQFADTLGSYPFASVNAYNFFSLVGGNWRDITPFFTVVSTVSIVGVTFFSFWFLYHHWSTAGVFFAAALLFNTTFTFVVRMHERYLFPALLFLMAAYVFKGVQQKWDWRVLALYGALSVTLFVNCMDVLLRFHHIYISDNIMPVISFAQVFLGVFALYMARNWMADEVNEVNEQ